MVSEAHIDIIVVVLDLEQQAMGNLAGPVTYFIDINFKVLQTLFGRRLWIGTITPIEVEDGLLAKDRQYVPKAMLGALTELRYHNGVGGTVVLGSALLTSTQSGWRSCRGRGGGRGL